MSKKDWPGGIISASQFFPGGPFPESSATGVWSLDQASYWQKINRWPNSSNNERALINLGYIDTGPTIGRGKTIDYLIITTTGNSAYFGDSTLSSSSHATGASATRGVTMGHFTGSQTNTIDYVTFSNLGNAIDFGDLPSSQWGAPSGLSNSTRALISGSGNINNIEYIVIATTGNGVDFGDQPGAYSGLSGCASPTRGVFLGGFFSPSTYLSYSQYVTIATTGNSVTFGTLTVGRTGAASLSSSTRGICCGGSSAASTASNVMDYITIASTGDAIDFGDLTVQTITPFAAAGSVRGVIGGGYGSGSSSINTNVIQYITIASLGNAVDFGDLTQSSSGCSAMSNSHGGL